MNFSDVTEGAYYAGAVRWAASLGIVTGLDKTTFGTANAVTWEQAVTMLWRFAKTQGFDTTQDGMAIREYDDYDSLSEYALLNIAHSSGRIFNVRSKIFSVQHAMAPISGASPPKTDLVTEIRL